MRGHRGHRASPPWQADDQDGYDANRRKHIRPMIGRLKATAMNPASGALAATTGLKVFAIRYPVEKI